MAHKTTYEESRQTQPAKVVNHTNAEGTRNKPRTSSVAKDGHGNGVHQGFWVDTVQY